MKSKKLVWALAAVVIAFCLTLTNVRANRDTPRIVHPLLGLAPVHTFVVTKTGDSGDDTHADPGTLRWAMVSANKSAGFDLIVFNISGSGVKTITVRNYLPDLTDNAGVMIDGTQSDDRIQIDGSNVTDHSGIEIESSNNVIKGLTINGVQGAGSGIALVNGASNNLILGNSLGVIPSGNASKANHTGVYIGPGSNNNWVGGTNGVTPGGSCTGDCNLLSGNRNFGVFLDHASGNHIVGNFIGLNAAGNAALPNGDDGILFGSASNNIIGGRTPPERNVIAASRTINIELAQNGTHDNLIQGNFVGLNSAGTAALSNPGVGIELNNYAHDNAIDGNVISGHANFGILSFMNATRTTITNNRIGIGAFSDINLGNRQKGIEIQGNNSKILYNRVAYSGNAGLRVKFGVGNLMSQNQLFKNGTLGIMLGIMYTENDPGDGDGGPNLLQNTPVLNKALDDGTTLTIQGTLNSRANGRYTLEFFYNPACDTFYTKQVGQALVYLGSTVVTTNSAGNASFSVPVNRAPGGGVVTSTATDSANNTSEISYCRAIESGQPAPPAPRPLSPSNGERVPSNPPLLDWAPSTGATRYQLVIKADSTTGTKVYSNQNITASEFTPPALAGGKTYFWRVAACNAAGCTKSVWFSFLVP